MLKNVFFNDREPRAGWRFALYIALVALFGVGLNVAARLLLGPPHGGVVASVIWIAAQCRKNITLQSSTTPRA